MKSACWMVAPASLVLAAALGAQDPVPAPGAADAPAPPLTVDPSRVRPRGTLYDVRVTTDSGTRHVGWHTVWVYDAVFSGRQAWEVFERRESHAPWVVRVTQDSTVLSRDQLQPQRWEATAGSAKLVAAFANDSVYGGATAPGARATFTVPVPRQVVTGEGTLDVVLQAAPLAEGWSASSTTLLPDLSSARVVPLELRVLRSETVRVPAGEFDAWVVRASAAGTERTIWVDKARQLVLRTLEVPTHTPELQVERVLVGGY